LGRQRRRDRIADRLGDPTSRSPRIARNTPFVLAPGLAAAGIETCLGSTSVGGAGPGFGVTIAGTTQDRGCNLRLFSRTLYSMGHKAAAVQILCNDPDVAAALALEGVRCLVGPAAEAEARAAASARAKVAQPAAPADVGKRPSGYNNLYSYAPAVSTASDETTGDSELHAYCMSRTFNAGPC
jgi:hypothetical protein